MGQKKIVQSANQYACLAGWDADNNAATSAGLLGIIHGYRGLPNPIRAATDVYRNEDVTSLPGQDSVSNIAIRTQALAEATIRQAGDRAEGGAYKIPIAPASVSW